jgi:Na+(H+)/acetate symporter ActP
MVLFFSTLAFFALGFMWGWFFRMPTNGELILVAVLALMPAYLIKFFLKYIGKEGALWTRVVGCLTSAMIALSSFLLAWGVGNGLARPAEAAIITVPIGFFTLVLVLMSFVNTLESILKSVKLPEEE